MQIDANSIHERATEILLILLKVGSIKSPIFWILFHPKCLFFVTAFTSFLLDMLSCIRAHRCIMNGLTTLFFQLFRLHFVQKSDTDLILVSYFLKWLYQAICFPDLLLFFSCFSTCAYQAINFLPPICTELY